MSLTTKLVLYTLFNQASSTLPVTAYIKLIDIWFFFCICTLLIIILVHVLVEHLPEKPTLGNASVLQISPSAVVRREGGGERSSGEGKRGFGKTTQQVVSVCLTADGVIKCMRYCVVPVSSAIFLGFYFGVIMGV